MIRRIARLLLVTVLFANQLMVCCAHSHEGPSGSTPHIHLGWKADGAHFHEAHSHGHHHGHSHSHDAPHSHHAPTKSNDDQHDSDSNLKQDSLSDQHEDSLIYCTDSNYLTRSNSDCFMDFCQLAISCESIPFVTSTTDHMPYATLEDARARYSYAIFLQTRSLRL